MIYICGIVGTRPGPSDHHFPIVTSLGQRSCLVDRVLLPNVCVIKQAPSCSSNRSQNYPIFNIVYLSLLGVRVL